MNKEQFIKEWLDNPESNMYSPRGNDAILNHFISKFDTYTQSLVDKVERLELEPRKDSFAGEMYPVYVDGNNHALAKVITILKGTK